MANLIPTSIANKIDGITKCSDTTFQSWKSGMQMVFRAVQAKYLLMDKLPDAVPADKKDLDEVLVFYIWGSIAEEMRYLVDGKESGLEAWKAVLDHFQKSNYGGRLKARKEFYNVVHDPSKPISVYIYSVEKAAQVLKNLKVNIEEQELTDILLMNLHESYSNIRTSILTSEDAPDLSRIKSILAGSSLPIIKQEYEDFILPAANAVRAGRRTRPSTSTTSTPIDLKGIRWCNPTNEGHCHRCGRPGHVAHLCIFDMPQHIKDWVMNGRNSSPATAHEVSEIGNDEVEELANNILGPLHI